MEEVQSWWEVPAVAHFYSVFREAFNLIYLDVGELEAAILNMQDPEISPSLEQLVTRLLQGCFDDGEVASDNWEDKLGEIFDEHCEEEDNPLNNSSFSSLTSRLKVEMFLKLCQIRLDIAVSMDTIKDMPAEDMQAVCIGQDGQHCSYWYFSDERLYKENVSKKAGKTGKQSAPKKVKEIESRPVQNGRSQRIRDKKSECIVVRNDAWSIVCHNLSDWEKLAKTLSASRNSSEKELSKRITNTYLPRITAIVAENERLLRKRYMELAPKRTSSRISKVQAQRKLEEQRVAEAEEKKREEYQREKEKSEVNRKQKEKEERKKRAEERNKIVEDRAKRVAQRGMMKNFVDDYDSSSNSDDYSHRVYDGKKSSSHSAGSSINGNEKSHQSSDSEDEESDSDRSVKQSSEESEEEDEGEDVNVSRVSTNNVRSRQPGLIHYDLTQWRSTLDTKGHKLHILRTPSSDIAGKKRFKLNEDGSYRVSPLNDCNSTSHKENHNLLPFQVRNHNTYGGLNRKTVVRLEYLKPSSKQVSS